MDFNIFEEKLKKLNPKLYIQKEKKIFSVNKEHGSTGIYLKDVRREQIEDDSIGYIKNKAGDYIKVDNMTNEIEKHNAEPDSYVGWVTYDFVPEGEKFDQNGKLIAIGWRTIVKRLVHKGITTEKLAKNIFGWSESAYDRLSYDQRREFELCQQ